MFVKRGEYPNPQFQRKSYVCLNGKWDFAIYSTRADLFGNGAPTLSTKIIVPFCPESKSSGVAYTDFINYCKYEREIKLSLKKLQDKRLLLHFGAVDYKATVLVNGEKVGEHIGGYVPFAVDITDFVQNGKNVLTVLVEDEKLYDQPRGKQSYKKESFGCFYTRVTGIWQTVWLEYVPKTRVECVQFYPDIVACSVTVKGQTRGAGICRITISYRGKRVGVAECKSDGSFECNCALSEKRLWELGQGNLYDVKISFEKDEISSYFGLREVKYEGMRFLLNGKSVMQKLVLDQGYYPDGIYTPATVKAYKADIQRAMRLGFNGARPHQKVFEPRYLYECDKAGFLLFGEYPSWGIDFSSLESLPLVQEEWKAVVERDFNHPSIALWCPLNEVWGNWANDGKQPDLAYIKELYRFAKGLDNTRPCIDVSGGYHCGETDVFDFHCYEEVSRIRQVLTQLDELDKIEVDLLYPKKQENRKVYPSGTPVQLSECGGITLSASEQSQVATVNEGAVESTESWGYGKGASDERKFVERYGELSSEIYACKKLSGFCYTQLYDIEQEQNGFYTYNRKAKLSESAMNEIAKYNRRRAAIERESEIQVTYDYCRR